MDYKKLTLEKKAKPKKVMGKVIPKIKIKSDKRPKSLRSY